MCWSEKGELKGYKNRQLIEEKLFRGDTKHISDSLKKKRTDSQSKA